MLMIISTVNWLLVKCVPFCFGDPISKLIFTQNH